jgi:predicted lipid-binding transport protein (Tim44 family)
MRRHIVRRHSAFVILPIVVLALLGGCAKGPPPRVWAASVCSALTPWRAEIATLTTRAQQQTPTSTTPGQAKENLVQMLAGAREASEKARGQVVAAGVPEVDGGAAVAAGMADSLGQVRDAYGRARDAVRDLPTDDSADFYDRVATVMVKLQKEYAASALDTSTLRSTELQKAFAEVPECH